MSNKRDELKAKLMAEVEIMLEDALMKGEDELSLQVIEDLALSARERMSAALTGSLLEQQVNQRAPVLPDCPDCGQRMHPKGKKGRYVRTRSGETRVERDYFYCATCQRGHFPPG